MKKAIALFLLAVMMLTALQPALALHFCQGKLRSVAIGRVQKSCCETAMESPFKTRSDNAGNTLYRPINTCCSTYVVELSTDNFQSPVQQSINDFRQPVFNSVLFSAETLLKGVDFAISLSCFPPGGPVRTGADLLTVICIFRI
ncbi:MAG: hypothetical protein LBP83_06635 [Dysgonamonadaceae bacterium]|jgi:hypothetical protein|nr:hypothetical protein [Dysgonamonadaceae bacterium]